jgi:hypothetical protein
MLIGFFFRYTQFFTYFGTHYVAQAQLGGSVRREELADIRNFTKLTEDFIHTQFAISFRYAYFNIIVL